VRCQGDGHTWVPVPGQVQPLVAGCPDFHPPSFCNCNNIPLSCNNITLSCSRSPYPSAGAEV
ncbi:MAG TPA: hypothetical protein VMW63_07890, partial [Methanoregulaceae archaeon]|nr:hypothetical protein [Methanoregulaceae archaeon]